MSVRRVMKTHHLATPAHHHRRCACMHLQDHTRRSERKEARDARSGASERVSETGRQAAAGASIIVVAHLALGSTRLSAKKREKQAGKEKYDWKKEGKK